MFRGNALYDCNCTLACTSFLEQRRQRRADGRQRRQPHPRTRDVLPQQRVDLEVGERGQRRSAALARRRKAFRYFGTTSPAARSLLVAARGGGAADTVTTRRGC